MGLVGMLTDEQGGGCCPAEAVARAGALQEGRVGLREVST
jgi:hypothetical protein